MSENSNIYLANVLGEGTQYVVLVKDHRSEVTQLKVEIEAKDRKIEQLQVENEALRHGMKGDYDLDAWLDWTKESETLRNLVADTGLELRKASSWICREVEAGTKSATHWAIRLREKADHIDAVRTGVSEFLANQNCDNREG